MSLELNLNCGVTHGGHSQTIVGVCHHCGLPLCSEHVLYIEDEEFARLSDAPPVYALHCEPCARSHHAYPYPFDSFPTDPWHTQEPGATTPAAVPAPTGWRRLLAGRGAKTQTRD
jgi:hypothetical protein